MDDGRNPVGLAVFTFLENDSGSIGMNLLPFIRRWITAKMLGIKVNAGKEQEEGKSYSHKRIKKSKFKSQFKKTICRVRI